MAAIGIYPGTFDPIHEGHIAFALATQTKCDLDQVIFLPENQPRKKVQVSDVRTRLQVIEKKINQHPTLTVKQLSSTPFTVSQTFPEIMTLWPETKFTLLLGSDVALTLPKWDNIDVMIKQCHLAVGIRSAQSEQEVHDVMRKLSEEYDCPIQYTIVQTKHGHVRSSRLRGES